MEKAALQPPGESACSSSGDLISEVFRSRGILRASPRHPPEQATVGSPVPGWQDVRLADTLPDALIILS